MNLIKKQSTFKLLVPKEVERKISHICQEISDVEWSGVLFYDYTGSIENKDLVLTCKDVYVMDIGSSSYTEFNMSPDVITYMCDNPELLDHQMALIHSHNRMTSFFSKTDTDTLKEEGESRNHFLSLIVNNRGEYVAAITRKVKYIMNINESYIYKSFEDIEYSNTNNYDKEVEEIEYFDLEIVKEQEKISFETIDNRLKEIKKNKLKAPIGEETIAIPKFNPFSNIKQQHVSLFDRLDIEDIDTSAINDEDVEQVFIQLITGSIIIKDPTKIDIDRWIKSMPTTFGNRFTDIKEYSRWADSHCEFLMFDKEPIGKTSSEETEWISLFADKLLDKFKGLPENEYTQELKTIIQQWTVM